MRYFSTLFPVFEWKSQYVIPTFWIILPSFSLLQTQPFHVFLVNLHLKKWFHSLSVWLVTHEPKKSFPSAWHSIPQSFNFPETSKNQFFFKTTRKSSLGTPHRLTFLQNHRERIPTSNFSESGSPKMWIKFVICTENNWENIKKFIEMVRFEKEIETICFKRRWGFEIR
jgi:hypothetical protein